MDGIYCWGANDHGQLGERRSAVSLVPVKVHGHRRSLAEDDYDSVNLGSPRPAREPSAESPLCWGDNEHGQLGSGSRSGPSQDEPTPLRVASPRRARPIERVAVSGPTVCSTSTVGRVFCWGDNSSGQLGNGTTEDASLPEEVVDPVGEALPPLPLVAAGPTTTCGAAADGRTWCWGSNQYGLLGSGTA